jgi:hypothetical protein
MAASKSPANKPRGVPARRPADAPVDDKLDDNGEPWRHPPVAPRDESPLKSLGESISETVTGPLKDKPGAPKA